MKARLRPARRIPCPAANPFPNARPQCPPPRLALPSPSREARGAGFDGAIFLKVSALDGGDEAKRMARALGRMLIRAAHARGVAYEVLDAEGLLGLASGGGAALLATEAGLHRFVDSGKGGKRHTSLCRVEASTAAPESGAEPIKESDVSFKSQKSGGPGGQHVNKTESAVRATHRPSGLSVLCSSERSQAENKRIALAWLQAKMAEAARQDAAGARREAWRGSRQAPPPLARSYWLDEDRCVDARGGGKMGAREALDGGCERFWPRG